MKRLKHLSVAATVTLCAVVGLVAQTNLDTSTQPVRDGQVLLPERPTAPDAANATTANLRPALAERPSLPPEVNARVERFKLDARAYLEQQEALKKQLQGANDKERAAIRERLRALREQWLERARELRKEFKERQAELADKLEGHRELLDSVRSSAQQQLQEAQQETRTRRGQD